MFDYFDFAVNSKPKNIANLSATDNSRKCLASKLQFIGNYKEVHCNFER